jgi:cytochrome oxidase Cu insertion factor (SCO1/SenC/PrrC family)
LLAEPALAHGAPGRISRGLALGIMLLAVAIGGAVGVGMYLLFKPASNRLTTTVVTMRNGLYGDATWAAGSLRAPAINTLHDQSGSRFALSSLHGHPVALVFFDSYCHQECPLEGRQLAAAERRLPAAQRPDLLVVSVNPKDTPTSVAKAIRAWGLAGVAPWHWLMGTHKQLAKIWAEYNIQVSPPIDGDINHTEALYLIDRDGDERAGYLWPFKSRFASYDMRVLAARKAA